MLILKKLFGWLIGSSVLIGLIILSLQTFLTWKNTQIQQTRLEIEHSGSLEERKQKQKEKESLDKEHKQAQIDATKGWQADDDSYKIQSIPEPEKCFSIEEVDPAGSFNNRKLFWSKEITNFFKDILKDLEDLTQIGKVNPSLDEKQDGEQHHFKRRNMVMYGAAGTGKTEFIKQMARIIQERYPNWVNDNLDPSNPHYKLLKEIERKAPPIIQIDGSALQTAGKGAPAGGQPDSYQKLVAIIKRAKEFYYGDKYSNNPYIVFVEEADQGMNVMTAGSGGKRNNLLEDWKNFLSSPRDSEELKGSAQDKNSCIIIATNNYEIIDSALFRRGRLGKKLNFNWNPLILKDYLIHWYTKDEELKLLNCILPQSESWSWDNNPEPEELYKMATKIGFDIAKTELAPNFPIILKSWTNLTETEKKTKEAELGTQKNEQEQDVCNWLLHYLFTFHQYNNKRQLYAFNDAKKIQRYDYGHQYRTEELQRNLIIQICNNIIALKNAIAMGLSQIRGEMASNFQETSALRQEILLVHAELKKAEQDINSIRSQVSANNSLGGGLNQAIANLQRQINSIVSGINSGSSSSSQQIAQKYNNLSQKIATFTSRLNTYLGGGGTDAQKIRDIVSDFINDIT